MSDHEFEKQVRQKLSNLKLTPTPEAWENIEEKLRERRRRLPLLWLPLLLAGMAVGGYYIINTGKRDTNNSLVVAQKTSLQNPQHVTSPPAAAGLAGQTLHSVQNQVINSPVINHKRDQPTIAAENSSDNFKTSDKENITAVKEEKPLASEKIAAPAETQNQPPQKTVTLLQPSPAKEQTPAVPKPVAGKNRDSKWAYAVHAYSGVSAEHEGGIFGFSKPKVEDIAYTSNFAATVANYAPVYQPSTISPGFTFSAGAEVKRELSKRFSISAGINYTQINTRLKVGDKINSSNVVNNGIRGYLYVQSYYQLDQNDNREYKNKYHFIELPITLHTRINNSSSLPIYWDAGFVVSRLLSSTSLHFDGTTGVYYKNDRLLNQTQAGVSTGLSFVLFNKTSHPLWIGPSARSNISSVLKKDISGSKHFVTLGLDVKLFLKK